MNENFVFERLVKIVRATHGGLEYVIQLDSGDKFTITSADFRRIGEDVLVSGMNVDEELFEDLEFSSEKLSCIRKSLKHLEYGAMTERKLKMKLHGKFAREVIEAAVDILKGNGYIDDMQLAMDLCEEYFENCRMSPAKVKAKLYQKGFTREVLAEVLAEYEFSEEIIRENIDFAVRRKFGDELSDEMKRKALEYLIRLGYSYEDSKSYLEFFE